MSIAHECDYCGAAPAPYQITEEDGQRIFLCAECRADVEYCARGGKPRPEEEEESEVEVENLWDKIVASRIEQLKGQEG